MCVWVCTELPAALSVARCEKGVNIWNGYLSFLLVSSSISYTRFPIDCAEYCNALWGRGTSIIREENDKRNLDPSLSPGGLNTIFQKKKKITCKNYRFLIRKFWRHLKNFIFYVKILYCWNFSRHFSVRLLQIHPSQKFSVIQDEDLWEQKQ